VTKEIHAKRRNTQSVIEHDVKHIFLLVLGLGNEIVLGWKIIIKEVT
jgi:hypothetical protein